MLKRRIFWKGMFVLVLFSVIIFASAASYFSLCADSSCATSKFNFDLSESPAYLSVGDENLDSAKVVSPSGSVSEVVIGGSTEIYFSETGKYNIYFYDADVACVEDEFGDLFINEFSDEFDSRCSLGSLSFNVVDYVELWEIENSVEYGLYEDSDSIEPRRFFALSESPINLRVEGEGFSVQANVKSPSGTENELDVSGSNSADVDLSEIGEHEIKIDFYNDDGEVFGSEYLVFDVLNSLPVTVFHGDNSCGVGFLNTDKGCVEENVCGNGVLENDEACDDGNSDSYDGCDSSCSDECLNGVLDVNEIAVDFGGPCGFNNVDFCSNGVLDESMEDEVDCGGYCEEECTTPRDVLDDYLFEYFDLESTIRRLLDFEEYEEIVESMDGTSIQREIIPISEKDFMVRLHISSDQHIVAIDEGVFVDRYVLNYELEDEYENVVFKTSEGVWVIADPNKQINTVLEYTVRTDTPDFVEGDVSYVTEGFMMSVPTSGDGYFCGEVICIKDVVYAGEPTKILLNPSSEGVYRNIYFYKDDVTYERYSSPCSTVRGRCMEEVVFDYTFPKEWISGEHTVRVYDYNYLSSGWKTFDFTLLGATEPKYLEVDFSSEDLNIGDTLSIDITPGDMGIGSWVYVRDYFGRTMDSFYLGCSGVCMEPIHVDYNINQRYFGDDFTLDIYDYGVLDSSLRQQSFGFHVNGGLPQEFSASVDYDLVGVGETVGLNIVPGSHGISSSISIYDSSFNYVDSIYLDCPNGLCVDSITEYFEVPSYYSDGDYQFEVYDYGELFSDYAYKYFSFSVSGGSSQEVEVSYSSSVNAGETFYIDIIPGSYGVDPYVDFYRDGQYLETYYWDCDSNYQCYDQQNVAFDIPSTWIGGEYYFSFYDYGNSEYVQYPFSLYSEATSNEFSATLDSYSVYPGGQIGVSVTAPSEGIYGWPYFVKYTDSSKTNYDYSYNSYIDLGCSGDYCFGDSEFVMDIPSSWPMGDYVLVMSSYGSEYKIDFEVSK